LYIAEIYEARKDWVKAREYYQYLLNELADFSEKENDDVSILMSEDLKQFVKYQMDGLHLKTRTEKRRKPNIGSVENLWFLVRLDVVRWT
jgi:hypothetical protein